MVLGLRTKNNRGPSVHVDYLIHVQEIKPWPPSQSLRSLRSVLIQWENGNRSSGSTNPAVPSLGSVIGEGKIDFGESFRLPVTLLRDMSVRGDGDVFQKNCLEFNLYEPRRDKAVKGQLLATAIIDLADYGVARETLSIAVPMNCKRSFRNTDQPILFIKIQPIQKDHTNASRRNSLSKEMSIDKNGGESVSALMDEEYAQESELASYGDDDASSHSSLAVNSTSDSNDGVTPHSEENRKNTVARDSTTGNKAREITPSDLEKSGMMVNMKTHEILKGNPLNGHASESVSLTNDGSHSFHSSSSPSSIGYENTEEDSHTSMCSNNYLVQKVHDQVTNGGNANGEKHLKNGKRTLSTGSSAVTASPNNDPREGEELVFSSLSGIEVNEDDNGKDPSFLEKAAVSYSNYVRENNGKDTKEYVLDGESLSNEDELTNNVSQDDTRTQVPTGSDTIYVTGGSRGLKESGPNSDRLKHVKSVRSPFVAVRSNGVSDIHQTQKNGISPGNSQIGIGSLRSNEKEDAKGYSKDRKSAILDSKMHQLEHRIKMLEGELREAAAIEASLYSVIPDHGSSMNKVHTPARRLSRLYLHACRESYKPRRASAARSAVSGLVLVTKACGNDVPRLTFWFSNTVVLRAIISQVIVDQRLSLLAGPSLERNGAAKGNSKISLKWKESSPTRDDKSGAYGNLGDWEDPHTFVSALEKIEAWIFSRIVESIWWQTLTPHMQSPTPNAIGKDNNSVYKKTYVRTSSSGDQEQGNFSLDLWRKAFKDACERLCPVRAGGHACGCLSMLARMIMEQCVARLDVAMFNAILRESADEIPSDPVSDPISDSKVLPIPAGKASFGAGAQLKNAIGNWSRWLTDIFGMDDDLPDDENDHYATKESQEKSFRLLNALSDLMMLPKDMLLSKSIRKEVCPTFGAPLIKRVLDNFVPDEFCPDPVPDIVLEALDSEDVLEPVDESVTNFPSAAVPTVYLPPMATSVASTIGYVKNQPQLRNSASSILWKSYTSDDELDELNSPLASIFHNDGPRTSPISMKQGWTSKENSNQNALRYELLRDLWMNSDSNM